MTSRKKKCPGCGNASCPSADEKDDHGYVKFAQDQDEGIWFHGIIYRRAQDLSHLPREEAMVQIRKEFGISP